MSIESGVRNQLDELQYSISRSAANFSVEVIPYFLPALDALVIVLTCVVSGIGYHLAIGGPLEILPLCAVGSLASLIYILRMNSKGYYGFQDSAKPRLEFHAIFVCWLTTGLLLALIAFLLKISASYSRAAFVIFYGLAPIALLGVRKVTKLVLAQAVADGAIGRGDTVLIGDHSELATLQKSDLLSFCGALELMRFPLSRDGDKATRSSKDLTIITTAAGFVRRHNCRQILIALPWGDRGRIEAVRNQVRTLPVAVRLVPDNSVRALSGLTWSSRNPAPIIELQRAPLSGPQRLVKRVADILIASFVLLLFLPIMAFAAIAIKMDSPGPIIFRQTRKGFNGKKFLILKFRTMTVQENGHDVVQATRGDSRVTGTGRLLRSTSIDELPQLWNVLRGDMSLIGPRPHALVHDNFFEAQLSDYAFRHHVKPGITGWAQCNGARGGTPTIEHIAERVKLDLWYVNNWSFWLDLLILIKTVVEVVRKRNAY
jgi:Undecaprenyl-phosphate glucose phosphotransferase